MTIIQKPRARFENGTWLVWCEVVAPSPRASFDEAYRAWARRRGLNQTTIGAVA